MKNLRWVLALYLSGLAIAVSYPGGPARPPWRRHYLNDVTLSRVKIDALVQDLARNIVLFLPAGYLGILMVGRTSAGAYTLVVVACAFLSFGIESVQDFFLPWRSSTWIDIVSNTLGDNLRVWRAEDPPPTI